MPLGTSTVPPVRATASRALWMARVSSRPSALAPNSGARTFAIRGAAGCGAQVPGAWAGPVEGDASPAVSSAARIALASRAGNRRTHRARPPSDRYAKQVGSMGAAVTGVAFVRSAGGPRCGGRVRLAVLVVVRVLVVAVLIVQPDGGDVVEHAAQDRHPDALEALLAGAQLIDGVLPVLGHEHYMPYAGAD